MRHKCYVSLLLLIWSFSAWTHQLSTAYLNAELSESGQLSGAVQLRLYDLQKMVVLDTDGNGELTWGETLAQTGSIQDWLDENLYFERNQTACQNTVGHDFLIDQHFNEPYLVLPIQIQCGESGVLRLSYGGVFAADQTHKLLVNITAQEQNQSRVVSAGQTVIEMDFSKVSRLQMVLDFLWQGMIHIWIGLDHILFLLCLLLACLLQQKTTLDKQAYKKISVSILGVVTAFTVAHSITLTATALDWIQLPSRWVEVSIAVSVLIAAVNNIIPLLPRLLWITFAFGLLHGMGFAGALGELGLPAEHRLWTVVAFNVGVEIGQIVILAVVLPVMLLLKKTVASSHQYFRACSAGIALMAVFWIVERL